MNYGDSETIKLKCYNPFGDRFDANRKIKIRIGDKTFTAKTDDNGIVKFKIPNKITPGKYQLTIIYKNGKLDKKQKLTVKTAKITKKITIKQVLNLKKVNVKKSAKKLTLTAKLSNKIKNKKITFKFNDKKYTTKTDKNGAAKITIKKTELNKLTVGKKLTYSVTYLKNTVKKTVKVKK